MTEESLNTTQRGVYLAGFTTFGVGGPAGRLIEVGDVGDLVRVLDEADADGERVLVLGEGSNVLISDDGFDGTVLRIRLAGTVVRADGDDVVVSAAAGEVWASFVETCLADDLAGVECLSGIPGLVGATPVQNVGAYGQEVRQIVEKVTVWDRGWHELRDMSPSECDFAYRSSVFKRNERYVVVNVTFRLHPSRRSQPLVYPELANLLGGRVGERAGLRETAQAVMELRRRKGMLVDAADPDTRSAGSFFTNPVLTPGEFERLCRLAPDAPGYAAEGGTRVPAGWLVEQSGFVRGYKRGRAAISSKHALAIIGLHGSTASDILALAREVRDGVRQRFGVTLAPEPVLVGLHL